MYHIILSLHRVVGILLPWDNVRLTKKRIANSGHIPCPPQEIAVGIPGERPELLYGAVGATYNKNFRRLWALVKERGFFARLPSTRLAKPPCSNALMKPTVTLTVPSPFPCPDWPQLFSLTPPTPLPLPPTAPTPFCCLQTSDCPQACPCQPWMDCIIASLCRLPAHYPQPPPPPKPFCRQPPSLTNTRSDTCWTYARLVQMFWSDSRGDDHRQTMSKQQ